MTVSPDEFNPIEVNRVFHDHECAYYDARFVIKHDHRSARRARREVETLLGSRLQGDVIVDVGCGTGWYAAGLRRATRPDRPAPLVLGVDLSAGMVGQARAAGAWPLLQAEAGRLPFADGTVDVIATRGVLHHLPDVTAALGEWRRVLRPDGGAVVLSSEPTAVVDAHRAVLVRCLLGLLRRPLSAEEDFWEVASMAANLHVFSPEEVAASARAAGFSDVAVDTSGFLATLLLAASYVVHGRRPGLARWVPWREAESAARRLDGTVVDRLLPARFRHTVVGVLRT